MLNVFPNLIVFGLFGPMILRIVLGLIFLYFGYTKFGIGYGDKKVLFENIGLKPAKYFVVIIALLEIVAGLMLVAGFLTQISAIFAGLISILAILIKRKYPESIGSSNGFLLLCFFIPPSFFSFFSFPLHTNCVAFGVSPFPAEWGQRGGRKGGGFRFGGLVWETVKQVVWWGV